MAFTVSIPGGIKDYDFSALVRQLEKIEVDITNTCRVLDPQGSKRWLPAWAERQDAEDFAARLRKADKNPRWQVYEAANVKPAHGPLGPIEILVRWSGDGYSYGLHPTSELLILRRFPSAPIVPGGMLIGAGADGDVAALHGHLWDRVATILTGLSQEQINELGGYRVYDQKAKRVLRDPPLLAG